MKPMRSEEIHVLSGTLSCKYSRRSEITWTAEIESPLSKRTNANKPVLCNSELFAITIIIKLLIDSDALMRYTKNNSTAKKNIQMITIR
jgi:hypothetical protein